MLMNFQQAGREQGNHLNPASSAAVFLVLSIATNFSTGHSRIPTLPRKALETDHFPARTVIGSAQER